MKKHDLAKVSKVFYSPWMKLNIKRVIILDRNSLITP